MKEILIGTHNLHKVKEISGLLSGAPLKVRSLAEFSKVATVVEDGKTLEENAIKKAKSYGQSTGLLTLADDTGLEVASLNGEPGVNSARYAGEHCSYEDNNRKLLEALSKMTNGNRAARFRCVIALFDPKTNFLETVEGAIIGEIVKDMKGENGFGYDPIFYLPEFKKTLAELTMEEKNKVSHRGQAVLNAKMVLMEKCVK